MEVIKNECISKLEVVRILQKAYTEGRIQAKDGLVSILDDISAADVQPVKRGKWEIPISVGNGIYFCSVCRNEAYWDTDYGQQLFDYCPYCGAEMIKG